MIARRTYRVDIRRGRMVMDGSIDLLTPSASAAEGIVSAWLNNIDPGAYVHRVSEVAGGRVEEAPEELSEAPIDLWPVGCGPDVVPATAVGALVAPIEDDAPVPFTGRIVALAADPGYVLVAWQDRDGGPVGTMREAFDALRPVSP